MSPAYLFGKQEVVTMSIALTSVNSVIYPVSGAGVAPRVGKPEPSRLPNRLRVLLVEDDDADVYLVRRALSELPRIAEVRVARDGVEALELIDSWSAGPDLAIVDLKMPRKDGFALLREFAARKEVNFPTV